MKRLLAFGFTAALTAASAALWAQNAPPTPEQQAAASIQTRQGLFKLMGQQFGPIGGMLRNPASFDAAVVARNAPRIEVLASMIPEQFTNDTRKFTGTPTKALEGIWNSQADFKVKADALSTAAAALTAASKGGDRAAITKAAGDVGRACGSCHDNYRAK